MSTIKEIAKRAGVSAGRRIADTQLRSNAEGFRADTAGASLTKLKSWDMSNAKSKRKTIIIRSASASSNGIRLKKSSTIRFTCQSGIGAEGYLNQNNIEMIRSFRGDNDFLSKLSMVDGLICIGKFSAQEISEFRKLTDKGDFCRLIHAEDFRQYDRDGFPQRGCGRAGLSEQSGAYAHRLYGRNRAYLRQ